MSKLDYLRMIAGVLVFFTNANSHALTLDNPFSKALDAGMGYRNCLYEIPKGRSIEFSVNVPYQLKVLSDRRILFGTEAFSLYWQVGIRQTGNRSLNELSGFVAVRKNVNERIRLGIQVILLQEFSAVFNSGTLLYGAIDGQLLLSPKTTVSMLLVNPNGSRMKIGDNWIQAPQSIFTGLQYSISKEFLVCSEVGYAHQEKPTLCVGTTYNIGKSFNIQSGLNLTQHRPTWGINLSKGVWKGMYAGSWHPILGISSHITMAFNW